MPDRLWLLALAIAAFGAVFAGRLFQLQVVRGAQYAQAVDQARFTAESLPPKRGRITDRNGVPLAETKATYSLAVVFSELELVGRARREVPLWRLDGEAVDALVADLGARLRWPGDSGSLRATVLRELEAHPAVAERTLLRPGGVPGLVWFEKGVLVVHGDDSDADGAELAGADLVGEDPRTALEHEIARRWGEEAVVLDASELQTAAAQLDREFGLEQQAAQDRAWAVLDPFIPGFTARLPDGAEAWRDRPLRVLTASRRVVVADALAGLLGEDGARVRDRLDRAIAACRVVEKPGSIYFSAAMDGEAVAGRLPPGAPLADLPLPDLPGARTRVTLVQGDPLDGEGLYTQFTRRLADTLGLPADVLQAVLEKHATRLRVAAAEREFRRHQLILDPDRLDALRSGLVATLGQLGRPLTRLDLDRLLAEARRTADQEWAGQTRRDQIPLVREVPHTLAVRLAAGSAEPPRDLLRSYPDAAPPLPGLAVHLDVGRTWPFPGAASHLIGSTAETMDEATRRNVLTGTTGLEATYDERLRGVPGWRLRVRTPDGVRILREEAAVDGVELATELDLELQMLAEDSLARRIELARELGTATPLMERSAAVGKGRAGFVMVDCNTGALLVAASNPGYRLDEVGDKYQELLTAPGSPLHNYATEPVMPPGSSFKIVTALAALDLGVLKPGESIHSEGQMAIIRGKRLLRDHAPPGDYDLVRAIQISSNVYFAKVAERIKAERLAEYCDLFRLGGDNTWDVFDMKARRMPPIPRPSTIKRLRPKEPWWVPNDTWRLGIGQFSSNSPMQVVTIAAAVANGGHIITPYLVRPSGGPPAVKDLDIPAAYLAQMRTGMENVTSQGGTARLLVLEGTAAGIKVAAKTGTSEWGSGASREAGLTPDNSWLIGYAPADKPTVAFAIFIHSGTFGGLACTPVVKRILELYFTKYGRLGHVK